MCGLSGALAGAGGGLPSADRLRAMRDVLAHRGPDAGGEWVDPAAGVALLHRRLAILDLSEAGAQPMASANGRWVLAYNGELYNFEALRAELDAGPSPPAWRGHSDSEVLVELIARTGVAAALPKLNGMFALAVWDRAERRLFLARDPFGEKPLYYGWAGGALVFGSELKALTASGALDGAIDLEALASYLRFGFVPHPRTIYRAVRKLPAGSWLEIAAGAPRGRLPTPVAYWDAAAAMITARARPFAGTRAEAAEALDELLGDAVRLRMASDVPLGALLSGGVDSSTIVALMQAQSGRRVQTFSIGFEEAGYNEADHAKAVAEHLGTDHTELYVDAATTLAVAPKLPTLYDEPFADSSQIPTFLVAELARRSVTVALSGDAGDELFGGYNRYFHGANVWSRLERTPRPLRRAAAGAITALSPDAWNGLAAFAGPLAPGELRGGRAGEKLHKLAGTLLSPTRDGFHQSLLSLWPEPERVSAAGARGLALPGDHPAPEEADSFAAAAMLLDTRYYLADDILAKVDRASMGVSLETRVPFLDTRVYDFAWRLPMAMKIGQGRGKLVLRDVLDRYVPRALIERPKQGFAVPVGRWLRGPLRDWGEALLSAQRLRGEGLLDAAVVRRAWDEHQSGTRDHGSRLWTVLMFQAWLEAGPHAAAGERALAAA